MKRILFLLVGGCLFFLSSAIKAGESGKEKNYFFTNPSFEKDDGTHYPGIGNRTPDDGLPDGWAVQYIFKIPREKQVKGKGKGGIGTFTTSNDYIRMDKSKSHSGNYSFKISFPPKISFYPDLNGGRKCIDVCGVKPSLTYLHEIWAFAFISIPEEDAKNLENKKCKFSVWVKNRNLLKDKLVIWASVHDEEGKGLKIFTGGGKWANRLYLLGASGTKDEWRKLSLKFIYPEGGRRFRVFIELKDHSSLDRDTVVWLDDFSLTKSSEE